MERRSRIVVEPKPKFLDRFDFASTSIPSSSRRLRFDFDSTQFCSTIPKSNRSRTVVNNLRFLTSGRFGSARLRFNSTSVRPFQSRIEVEVKEVRLVFSLTSFRLQHRFAFSSDLRSRFTFGLTRFGLTSVELIGVYRIFS